MGTVRNKVNLAAVGAALAVLLCVLSACSPSVTVDDSSPRVVEQQDSVTSGNVTDEQQANSLLLAAELTTTSDMTEASQKVQIRLPFDGQISVEGDCLDDFSLLLNGSEPDSATVKVEASASADAITITLSPADGASGGAGSGQFFAMYQAQFSLSAKRDDGALPHVRGASGSTAVLQSAIEGTLPSGLSIQIDEQHAGSAAENMPAYTTFTVTSPAQARVITWFSPDGGSTILLKHNHNFAQATAEDCAIDLAKVVNDQEDLGIQALANGEQVTLVALEVEDQQLIEPVVVEGIGVHGGVYDGSQGTEA